MERIKINVMEMIDAANDVTGYVKLYEEDNPFPDSECGVQDIKVYQTRMIEGEYSPPPEPQTLELGEQKSPSKHDKHRASTLHKSFYTLYKIHSNLE